MKPFSWNGFAEQHEAVFVERDLVHHPKRAMVVIVIRKGLAIQVVAVAVERTKDPVDIEAFRQIDFGHRAATQTEVGHHIIGQSIDLLRAFISGQYGH